MQNPNKINTNLFFDTDTSLRHYHHNNHIDHHINSIHEYIDHFYSGTANNSMSDTALLKSPLEIALYIFITGNIQMNRSKYHS